METAFYILMVYYTGFILSFGIAMHFIKKYKTKDNPWFAALLSWVIVLFVVLAYIWKEITWIRYKLELNKIKNMKRNKALRELFRRDSFSGASKELTRYKFYFCWVKTLICLLLNRVNGSALNNEKEPILEYNESFGYESVSWDSVWVSEYLFKDWNVSLYGDGC